MFGRKSEKEVEEIAEIVRRGTESLGDRHAVLWFIRLALAANVIVWLAVLVFPGFVLETLLLIFEFSNKFTMLLLGIPFGMGFWLAYAVCMWFFPDVEDGKDLDSDIMASYGYQEKSRRRWIVWLISAASGIVNLALLIAVAFALGR